MDRVNARGVPFAATPPSASGWTSESVWRERVRDARRAADPESPISVLLEPSAGWDPVETWRIRVQRPRRAGP